jgi:prepilin-type N-terminal cleavage/methylation domain-containing protein
MPACQETGRAWRMRPAAAGGFTLVEVAVVLAIVALLVGGLLVPLSMQVDLRRTELVSAQLEEAKQALLGFAIANGRLPCPDTDSDGFEDVAGLPPLCAGVEGDLPWATLNVDRQDPWGNPLRYRADDAFSDSIPVPPNTTSGLAVQTRGGAIPLTSADPNAPAAVLFSCGKNGMPDDVNDASGTLNTDSVCTNPGPNDGNFGTYVQDTFLEGTYDDVLVWMSKHTLVGRLVMSGTWP